MPTVVGVKLKYASRVLWFDPAGTSPVEGDFVVVTTERGQEYGQVALAPHEVEDAAISSPLKPVVRVADEADLARAADIRARESDDLVTFRRLVTKHKLDMKPIGVEHLFDGSKSVFYFAAEERVDFRELVRDMATEFHTRIDMRQVGVRDEARMVGGLGHCGQQLCCSRFAGDFQPVSIRMAKEQDLPLNPLKISGLCGRLMCCLRYEYDAYKDFKQRAPKCGTPVETPTGAAKVTSLNVPRETVGIRMLEGGPEITVPLEVLDCSAGRGCPCVLTAEAMPVAVGPVGAGRGTTPSLREAVKMPDTGESGQRSQRSRRKRQPGKPEGAEGGSSGQPAAERQQPKPRPQKQRPPAQQQASGTPEAEGTSSTRRRRRRRPRQGGSETPGAS